MNNNKLIANYFSKQPEVGLVYLIGSQARGEANKDSDIDVAVYFVNSNVNQFYLQGKYVEELTNICGVKVDVVNMNAADLSFNYRILQEGQVIYTKDPDLKTSLQVSSVKRYFDLKPSLDLFAQNLANRARSGQIGEML